MNPSDKQRIRQEAIDWVVKQQLETFGPAQQRELEQWLSLSPAHGMALAEAERAWEIGSELDPFVAVPARQPRSRSWRRFWPTPIVVRPAQVFACVVLLCGVALAWQPVRLQLQSDYYTDRGEIREVQLDDGSRVMLSGRTAISVDYDQQQRRVRLLRGEALFSPAPLNKRELRPFVVEAAGGLSRALGTVFLVKRNDADHGQLSVLEHSVQISLSDPSEAGQPPTHVVDQGQSVRYRRHGEIEPLALPASQVASWTQGLLSYDNSTLGEVMADLNAFGRDRILLLDPSASQLPVTAAFHLDSLDKALQMLSEQHQLRVVQLPGGFKLVY